eukprot:TRINITY_DN5164_c0_g1_i12.p2 TRINITY_DN5164_c0_g1~~TRINITY_DN5164_c0_g1_i12.p2  ORF type:complete len:108 (-),score=2.36 TRINITY_DN5164_c0_g1_i12:164-487(-)
MDEDVMYTIGVATGNLQKEIKAGMPPNYKEKILVVVYVKTSQCKRFGQEMHILFDREKVASQGILHWFKVSLRFLRIVIADMIKIFRDNGISNDFEWVETSIPINFY